MPFLPYALTTVAVAGPWLYFFPPQWRSTNDIRPTITLFLLLHTLYILYWVIVWPPENIFSHLGIPLFTPTETIRGFLVKNSPRHRVLDQLVTRMGSFETRTFYVRFGHTVVATCEHCHGYYDFALYAIPGFVLSYIRQAAVLGVVTIRGSGKERYRTYAVWMVLVVAIVEAYWISTVNIRIPRDSSETIYMWHDNLTFYRNIFFILTPIILHFVPLPPSLRAPGGAVNAPVDPLAIRQANTLQNLINKLQLLKYTRGAIARSPALSSASQNYWNSERQEGEWVRKSDSVQSLARRTGFGYDPIPRGGEAATASTQNSQNATAAPVPAGAKREEEEDPSKLRKHVLNMIQLLFRSFTPSDYWQPPPPPTVVTSAPSSSR